MILFTAAWRLFFPAAGLFAAFALPVWLLFYARSAGVTADAFTWHRHEMLWGYLSAALAGFLLTAIPNWTGRPALKGAGLAALFALWLAGRAAMFIAPESLASGLIALTFLPVLAALAARDIIKAGNRRNLVVVALILALALGEALMLFGPAETGINAGFGAALLLMVLIGGRITPAFTRNWLMKRSPGAALPAPFGLLDKAAMALSGATALAWVALGLNPATGALAALGALALAARLGRWRGWAVRREPLLLAQHAAYLWLAIALALLALASLGDWASLSQVRHALGAGAVAGMSVIVMLRAALGHSGRPIEGGIWDWLLLGTLHLGGGLRVAAGWVDDPALVLNLAGLLWAAAMLVFVFRIAPIALTPRR